MNRVSKVLFIAAASLAMTGVAFADDPKPDPAAGGGGAEAGAGAGATVGAGGATGGAAVGVDVGAGAAMAWPGSMIDRPFTLLKGKIGAYGDFDIATLSVSSMGMSSSFTQEQLHLGGGFGITDKITVGLDYAFPIAGDGTDNSVGKGPLTFYGMLGLAHSPKMTVAAVADFSINLCGTQDAMGCSATKQIQAGLDVKYLVAPKVALFTGSPFGPGPVGAASPFFSNHLSISLEDKGAIAFSIPVGVGFQATPQIFAFASTTLTDIFISNGPVDAMGDSKSAIFIGSDDLGIPANIGGFYSVNKNIDVGLNIFDDLKHAGDLYIIALAARWYN